MGDVVNAALRQIDISVEVFCIILCAILLVCIIPDLKNGKFSKIFLGLVISDIFLLLGDISDWSLRGVAGETNHIILCLGLNVFYFSIVACAALFIQVIYKIFQERNVKIVKHFKLLCSIPVIVVLALLIISIPTGLVFRIDENNMHIKGPAYYLVMLIFLVFIFTAIHVIKDIKKLPPRYIVSILSFVGLTALGQVIQSLYVGVATGAPALTLAIVMGVVFIISEEKNQNNKERNESLAYEKNTLENIKNQQSELLSELMSVLGRSIEAKDAYTQGHSSRVADYTKEIVYRMGGTAEEQLRAYYVGILHDIGKLRIPDTIINKSGKLTDEEYESIKLHPVSGYHILKGVKSMPEIYEGARWHHERYDGGGYPNGLSGEDIPYLARVIAVADAYDAMTSNRSYRNTMPQKKVREEIERGKGTQFDPVIADVMLSMIDEDISYEMQQYRSIEHDRIILIDDDEMMHQMVTRALEGTHSVLSCALSGEEGIEQLKEFDYELCLLDFQMPGMDGFEVLEWIQKNRPKLKVIFFTGDKKMDIVRRALELGVKDYVTKPVKPAVLKECLQNVLAHN